MQQVEPNTTRSEKELLPLLIRHDRGAYEYLYDTYSPALYALIKRKIHEDAKACDVLQNVFVNICRTIGEYNPATGPLFAWIRDICIAECNAALADEKISKRDL